MLCHRNPQDGLCQTPYGDFGLTQHQFLWYLRFFLCPTLVTKAIVSFFNKKRLKFLTTSQMATCLSFILENPVVKSMFISPRKTTWELLLPGCPNPCWKSKTILWVDISEHKSHVSKDNICLKEFWKQIFQKVGGGVAQWLGHWTCNPVVPGSSPPTYCSLDLFLVAQSSTPWLHHVNNQLNCLLPGGIFKHFMFIWNICFSLLYNVWPTT